jgi:hypothetical protein
MLTQPIDLVQSLAEGFDPVLFCRNRLGFEPDDWQSRFLRSESPQVIMCCGRQTGKSTVVAALATHGALYHPGSLCILIAPSQRQSRELAIKVQDFLGRLEPAPVMEEENKLSLMLSSGSRIVALPGDNPKFIRGFSAPRLVIEDESAFVADETHSALTPMLAAAPDGRRLLLSTPNLRAGHFHDIWHGTGAWERYRIKSSECPRISQQWLEERKAEDPLHYEREYEAEFASAEDSLFGDLDRLVSYDFEPFFT